MPAITCPCCRAANDAGPQCRRCSTDLSLLFKLEGDREMLLARAGHLLTCHATREARSILAQAESLRPGSDIDRLRAVAHLLERQFESALQCHEWATRR